MGPGRAEKMFVNRVKHVVIMVFDGGVQPPNGPHFWGVRAEAQICPKHCFFDNFDTLFCLPVSRDFAKKRGNTRFLGC